MEASIIDYEKTRPMFNSFVAQINRTYLHACNEERAFVSVRTESPGAVRTPMARGHGECKFENASFSFANSIILNASGYVVVRSRDFSSLWRGYRGNGASFFFFFFFFFSRRERGGHGWSWSRGISVV